MVGGGHLRDLPGHVVADLPLELLLLPVGHVVERLPAAGTGRGPRALPPRPTFGNGRGHKRAESGGQHEEGGIVEAYLGAGSTRIPKRMMRRCAGGHGRRTDL